MGAHAQGQSRRTSQDEPGVERRQDAAVVHRRFEVQGIEIGLAAEYGAAHRVAMAADILRQGMDHEVGAEIEGPRGDGRGEGRIDRHVPDAAAMGQLGDGGDVGQAHDRIGRRLDPDHLGARRDGAVDGVEIGGVDEAHLDPETRKTVADELGRAYVVRIGDHEMIARRKPSGQAGHGSPPCRRRSRVRPRHFRARQASPPAGARSDWIRGRRRSLHSRRGCGPRSRSDHRAQKSPT